jgi:hypothetical protein
VEQLKKRVLASADPIAALNGKIATGGRVNAAKAVGNNKLSE